MDKPKNKQEKISFLPCGGTPLPVESKQVLSLSQKPRGSPHPATVFSEPCARTAQSPVSGRAGTVWARLSDPDVLGVVQAQQAVLGNTLLLPAPVPRGNTATSNQGVNSVLTRKVRRVLILRPSSYFKITTALNRW